LSCSSYKPDNSIITWLPAAAAAAAAASDAEEEQKIREAEVVISGG